MGPAAGLAEPPMRSAEPPMWSAKPPMWMWEPLMFAAELGAAHGRNRGAEWKQCSDHSMTSPSFPLFLPRPVAGQCSQRDAALHTKTVGTGRPAGVAGDAWVRILHSEESLHARR